ncbi:MAG TPA: hypothetical protein VJG90_01355 [Candidatus Nanoarchaeia archaeon]|nr:hypothetical protein [Candidatus Nanoarchaeia archaeon]
MIPKYHKDLLWAKELTALVFIMLLSLLNLGEGSWLLLIVACFLLFGLARLEEHRFKLETPPHLYFCHTSSYFVLGAFFFTAGYFMLKAVMTGWLELFHAIGIVLFSVGVARMVFSKSLRPFYGL